MKKLMLTLTCLAILTNLFSANPESYLKVKGNIMGNESVTSELYMFSEVEDKFVLLHTDENIYKYKYRLNPIEKYKMVFTNNEGVKKVVFVELGNSGMFKVYIDIDFKKKALIAYMAQYKNYYNIKAEKL